MNLYEIRLEDDIIYNSTLLDAFLFDCKCALFLVDINNPISFDKVKTIISLIDNCNLPHLKKIIVENKSDIKTDKSNEAIEKYISENSKSNIDYIKISLKTEDNLENLLVKIYDEISLKNSEKPIFPIDRVSKCLLKEFPNAPSVRPLSFILIGDSAVGKSNFLSRYIKNAFSLIFLASIRPVISEKKMVLINGKNFYELTIWDTAGQERFRSMPKTYYRNVDGILLLFDINDKSTFEDVNNWMDDVNENIDTAEGEERDVIIYLLGNKIDLKENDDDEDKKEEDKKEEEKKEEEKKEEEKEKEEEKKEEEEEEEKKEKVTRKEIEELADKLKVKYYDISCKWNLNVDEVMARIVLDCIKKEKEKEKEKRKTFAITNERTKTQTNKRGGCCDKKGEK